MLCSHSRVATTGIGGGRFFQARAHPETQGLRIPTQDACPGMTKLPFLTSLSIVIKYNYYAREVIKLMGNVASAATAGQSELLNIEQTGVVLTVGLNRPAKRNALNDGIILALQDCFANLPDGIGAVVIHGFFRPRSVGIDRAGRHRGPAAFADVASGVRPHSI